MPEPAEFRETPSRFEKKQTGGGSGDESSDCPDCDEAVDVGDKFCANCLDPALAACERALDLAAPRNYRLIHADGLVLRARIALAGGDAIAARNDAESALQIAEPCEYAWAERDACEVLAQAWRTLGNLVEPARYAGRAANLNRRLTPAAE